LDQAREVRWEYLLPQEFEQAVAERPVCYMPLGTLERHGSHLPFGLDAMKAHGCCLAAAQKYGGIVLPPLHWGTHGAYAEELRRQRNGPPQTQGQAPGTVYIPEGLLINLLLSMFREIEFSGFEVVVAHTGHYPHEQIHAVRNAAAQYMVGSRMKIWPLFEPELSGNVEVGADHAGKWETSLLWALHPELVQMERCPDPETGAYLWCSATAHDASRELGEKTVAFIADRLGQRALKLLEEARAAAAEAQ
jgi:creatinine amidohydrolase